MKTFTDEPTIATTTPVLMLGTASLVTLGDGAGGEPNGQAQLPGISED